MESLSQPAIFISNCLSPSSRLPLSSLPSSYIDLLNLSYSSLNIPTTQDIFILLNGYKIYDNISYKCSLSSSSDNIEIIVVPYQNVSPSQGGLDMISVNRDINAINQKISELEQKITLIIQRKGDNNMPCPTSVDNLVNCSYDKNVMINSGEGKKTISLDMINSNGTKFPPYIVLKCINEKSSVIFDDVEINGNLLNENKRVTISMNLSFKGNANMAGNANSFGVFINKENNMRIGNEISFAFAVSQYPKFEDSINSVNDNLYNSMMPIRPQYDIFNDDEKRKYSDKVIKVLDELNPVNKVIRKEKAYEIIEMLKKYEGSLNQIHNVVVEIENNPNFFN